MRTGPGTDIETTPFKRVSKAKSLQAKVDQNLKWDEQLKLLGQALRGACFTQESEKY